MIGNEAARGTEFQAFGGSKPNHVTLAIYTINWRTYGFRNFEMDIKKFSPNNSSHVNSTWQINWPYVTMYSPLQMAADLIEHYNQFPDAFQFIKT
jgi:hypothetical protein